MGNAPFLSITAIDIFLLTHYANSALRFQVIVETWFVHKSLLHNIYGLQHVTIFYFFTTN